VQQGAGAAAGFADSAYADAGAELAPGAADVLGGSDAVLKVQAPSPREAGAVKEGAVLVALFTPARNVEAVQALAARQVAAHSLELLPRTTRAQSMDALSSQSTVAGYRSVLIAAGRLHRFFPMLMTAAGTVPPAKVLVLGAGVAGLQAIATARRLGAVVMAYDVRSAAEGEVRSLGARFLNLGLGTADAAGGYAAELGEGAQSAQHAALTPHLTEADVVITTAQIPGRRAPLLVTREMVQRMRPGSIVVDLASDTGGNVEISEAGREIDFGGVAVIGVSNPASALPTHASQMYSRNVANLVLLMTRPAEDGTGRLEPDYSDEIMAETCVTRGGQIVHEPTRAAAGADRP
ncbi:MAG: NAD(P) transhydrogenase subunit alpha, partial [Acidimicrobiales bacterium]